MWKPVYSKTFYEKWQAFVDTRKDDIEKAIKRVLVDPDVDGYKRFYLSPYKQEHPSDKTMTIFFVIPAKPANRVFFVWVNDDDHPHDTHKNHGEDPCVKEFKRLRDSNSLEVYSEDYHEGKLTPKPRPNAPTFLKFEKYGLSVHANILHDGDTYYSLSIATPNNPNDLVDHYALFIEKIREHFLAQKAPFEFRVFDGDAQFGDLLEQNMDLRIWQKTITKGETTYSI